MTLCYLLTWVLIYSSTLINSLLARNIWGVYKIKIEPVALDHRDKTAFMVVVLSRPEGATLKEMAEALGWKENSIRGAMSAYAKKTGGTIASKKKEGIRTYYLKTNA